CHLASLSTSFCFTVPAPTEIYTLSLHDALPICHGGGAGTRARLLARSAGRGRGDGDGRRAAVRRRRRAVPGGAGQRRPRRAAARSEEHTSELQSLTNLVCRLLLEKTKRAPCPPP